jgi:hypothetical protein
MAGPFLRSNADKDATDALVAEGGRSILYGKDMYFKPNVPPRLLNVVRHIRGRDSYEVRDKGIQLMFPHTVTQRELSIGERSRSGRDPIIRAFVHFNLDPTPWLKDGERASSRSRSPPDLNRGPPRFPDIPDSMLPPGVSAPASTMTRPQYYPGYIPFPMPTGPSQMPYPPGFTPGSAPQPFSPSSSASPPRGPPPPGPWVEPPYAPPFFPGAAVTGAPPAGPPGLTPFPI